jgi:hypothetical protein
VSSEPTAPEKPQLSPAERRRRKERRAWIPTFIIAGVISAAVVAAVVFELAGAGHLITPPPGNSKFNIAGLRVINGAADVQIDVRKPLSAKSVDLPANSSKTFGPFDSIKLEVDLVGTSGEKPIFVDSMHVVTRDGLVTSISTSTHDFGYLFIRTQLASLNVLGLTSKQMADFQNAMPNGAGDAHSFFTLPFGTGDALGVPTAVTVSCAGPKGCTITTRTTLPTK